jgi:hypothetical protein
MRLSLLVELVVKLKRVMNIARDTADSEIWIVPAGAVLIIAESLSHET